MNNQIKKTNIEISDTSGSSLFVNEHSVFMFRKIEKIVTALYMITEFFVYKEPLKWNIRNVSNDIIKDILILTKKSSSKTTKTLKDVHRGLVEVSSYVSLGHSIGLISNMNFSILSVEILKVSSEIENEIKRHPDIKETVRQDFFNINEKEVSQVKGHSVSIKDNKVYYKSEPVFIREKSNKVSNQRQSLDSLTINESRRSKIIDVIREKGRVSIKDIIFQIPKCSSKTIQRDLVKLIDDGFVLKEGDRRWSMYFLKQ